MQKNRHRKPIVALLMSAVLPGFGQLYNGDVNRAIWLYVGFTTVNIPWLALLTLYLPGGLLIPMLLLTFAAGCAIWIFGMVDAWRQAGAKADFVPERWQSSGMYALVFILCNLVALPALTIYVRSQFVEPFRIPSASMEPTVLRGDFLFADKRYNCPGCKYRIEQGDIAIFAGPNDRTRLSIKRVIALPGDRVRIDGRTVSVNGVPLSSASGSTPQGSSGASVQVSERGADGRQWTVQWDTSRLVGNEIDLTVPPGHVFVLGDNRSNSQDSRQNGPVSMEDVIGRARQIWFSLGEDGVRWQRLGQRIG